MTEKQKQLIAALNASTFIGDEEKKQWFNQASSMPDELVDILIAVLQASSQEEFDALKERIHTRRVELKNYAEDVMHNSIKNIYATAEQAENEEENNREEDLINQLDKL